MKKICLLLCLLLLPCLALGEEARGMVLMSENLAHPVAALLPGAPLEECTDDGSESVMLARSANWYHVAFPEYGERNGSLLGFVRGNVVLDTKPALESFPEAKVLRDFELESADNGLGFTKDGSLKAGDTVRVVGMTSWCYLVYANGLYGAIPKCVYDMDYSKEAVSYLEVDEATQQALKALVPTFAVNAEEYRQFVNRLDAYYTACVTAYGYQIDRWPQDKQQEVATLCRAVNGPLWTEAVVPQGNYLPAEEAEAAARAMAKQIFGGLLDVDGWKAGIIRIAADVSSHIPSCWRVTLYTGNEKLIFKVSDTGAAVLQTPPTAGDQSLMMYDLLSDYWKAEYAHIDVLVAQYGDFVRWPLEEKYQSSPLEYPMPGENTLDVNKAMQIAIEHAATQGMKVEARDGGVTFIDTGRIFQEDVPGVYLVTFATVPDDPNYSIQYVKVYMDAATGDILGYEVEKGNG